jgi:hypothetical protein
MATDDGHQNDCTASPRAGFIVMAIFRVADMVPGK